MENLSPEEKKALREKRKIEEAEKKKAKFAAKANQPKPWEKKNESNPPPQSENTEANTNNSENNNKKKKKEGIRLKQEFINTTPVGEKKDLSGPLAQTYDPSAVEAAWSSWWEAKGFFSPDYVAPGKKKPQKREQFVMVIPPPNVTGSLHIGHALTNSIEDCLARYNRMRGKEVLWVPGTDHAGIATQSVVEKRIWKEEKKTKYDLGREAFVNRVWDWKNEYANRITSQLRRLGSSLDWKREVFTMDERLSKAVTEAFVRLYDAGLIYRADRLVNWSCVLRTAISDIECEDLELEGKTNLSVPGYDSKFPFGAIWKFAYKIQNSEDRIIVATTRPETMLGDTAIAVHPDDVRYKHLHGKFAVHPFVDRLIPIICDPILVDMTFGTGAVKVTPGHDPNDYETGKRHNLQFLNILTDDGRMNNNCGEFSGLKRFDCRVRILKSLQNLGLHDGIAIPNKMRLKICSRSGDIIEPIMKPQWWANMEDLAKKSVDAVKNGDLVIIPEAKKSQWFQFLENIQPWCISRQLWWGHQIPAWMIVKNGQKREDIDTCNPDVWVIARNEEEAQKKAYLKLLSSHYTLVRDPDVLDTWFSSGLFPFSVLGWPEETPDFKRFYPNSILETGHDIIFFWVARMVMMGLSLTGKLPFHTVFLHSMIRDAIGRKMSKSLGNVIDPIDVIEGITLEGLHKTLDSGNLDPKEKELAKEGQKKDFPKGISECGTDALRFGLCAYCQQGKDINLDIKRIESYRNFCNKIWNATKLASMYIKDNYKPPSDRKLTGQESSIDLWILHRLNLAIKNIISSFDSYEIGLATTAVYNFWLYETCDFYLEAIKPIMYGEDENAKKPIRNTLYIILDDGYKLISPFMPFISEELWQRLPRRPSDTTESICVAEFPTPNPEWDNPAIDAEIDKLQKIINTARSLIVQQGFTKSSKPNIFICSPDNTIHQLLEKYRITFNVLAYTTNFELTQKPLRGLPSAEVYGTDIIVYIKK